MSLLDEEPIEMIRLVAAWVLVNGLFLSPQWLNAALTDGEAPAWVALEAAAVVGLLALLPRRRWSGTLVWAAALGVVLVTILVFANGIFLASLARPLNLSLDLYLLGAVYNLSVGNAGLPMTIVTLALVALATMILTLGLAWMLTPADSKSGQAASPLAPKLGGVALIVIFALGMTSRLGPGLEPLVATPVFQLLGEQSELFRATRREREAFASTLAGAPDSDAKVPGLLVKLRGADVFVTFIESYGMAAVEDPEFAAVIRPRLDTLATRMEGAGIHLVTGVLTSPTHGGQSWYAHGTLMSGLWLENQLRYDLLMASDRETLVDDFHRAGYRTAALMPATTMNWPDGVRLGYDDIYTARTIPYAGPPMYWVTMPDQFTWSFLAGTVRSAAEGRPLFVETAMVSSHAPWTPVLPMVDWDSIGDGSAFEPFRQDGHPPEELWIDTSVLRHGYSRSLDYSLQAMTGFAERSVDDRTLLIVLGDHQAAPWVTGAVTPEVPVHVFARDPALLEPFLAWGLRAGAIPVRTATPARMDDFREWFVQAFSGADHD